MKYNQLISEEEKVIVYKWIEPLFTGEYDIFKEEGLYICRISNAPLFSSKGKFGAGCGWPRFDESLPIAIKREPGPDGIRVEIGCSKCNAHLGYEFVGEQIIPKNTHKCINSLSMRVVPKEKEMPKTIHG
jgi:peptide-methionine (R)-S-oxide reductase